MPDILSNREKAASYRSQNTFSASFWLTRYVRECFSAEGRCRLDIHTKIGQKWIQIEDTKILGYLSAQLHQT